MKVTLATCKALPEPDVDEPLLLEALQKRGADVRLVAWEDTTATFDAREPVVIRSTWNYVHDLESFLRWVDRTPHLFNPARIVRSNARKTYLRDLAARGIDIIPTEFVAKGESHRLTLDRPVIIKPVVSAGSLLTKRFEPSQRPEAQAFLDALSAEREAMIQPWMPTIETTGERCLIWIAGELTHAVRKAPRYAGGAESVSASAIPIADDERAFALRVLEGIGDDLLYGRVDILRDETGTLRLMELELIEPSLFLKQHPPAIERFADAIVRL
jgi:glutathione synthase/RimK-type ligase-like ATP-grasp enzyme